MEAARDKLRQQTIQMPWTKVNRVDDDIRSNIWLRSVAGTISPEYQVTGRNNTSVVDWTLQQGTGNGDRFNTSVAIEAAGSYLNSERQALKEPSMESPNSQTSDLISRASMPTRPKTCLSELRIAPEGAEHTQTQD